MSKILFLSGLILILLQKNNCVGQPVYDAHIASIPERLTTVSPDGTLVKPTPRASEGDVTAAQLLALTNHGALIKETENQFRMDEEKPKNVSMFNLTNATFWTADMDIDSDGRETPICNKQRDPWHQNEISAGADIAADETPYFVIPIGKPSNSKQRGIQIGQVAAIIYKNQIAYAVFLDECGDKTLIGEASVATANLLGVDSDPKTGGTDGPVTYIVFTGESGRITDPKDYPNHAKAVEIGVKRAKELLAQYAATNAVAKPEKPAAKQ